MGALDLTPRQAAIVRRLLIGLTVFALLLLLWLIFDGVRLGNPSRSVGGLMALALLVGLIQFKRRRPTPPPETP